MSKIIRLYDGCYGCPYIDKDCIPPNIGFCLHPNFGYREFEVGKYKVNKTIHPDCPLDDEKANDATCDNEGKTLMELLEAYKLANIMEYNDDNEVKAIVIYLENHASEYADYVLKKKTSQIKRDATKHIRAVVERELKEGNYQYFGAEGVGITNLGREIWNTAVADVKDKEAGG